MGRLKYLYPFDLIVALLALLYAIAADNSYAIAVAAGWACTVWSYDTLAKPRRRVLGFVRSFFVRHKPL